MNTIRMGTRVDETKRQERQQQQQQQQQQQSSAADIALSTPHLDTSLP
jgi:hypothetical protein